MGKRTKVDAGAAGARMAQDAALADAAMAQAQADMQEDSLLDVAIPVRTADNGAARNLDNAAALVGASVADILAARRVAQAAAGVAITPEAPQAPQDAPQAPQAPQDAPEAAVAPQAVDPATAALAAVVLPTTDGAPAPTLASGQPAIADGSVCYGCQNPPRGTVALAAGWDGRSYHVVCARWAGMLPGQRVTGRVFQNRGGPGDRAYAAVQAAQRRMAPPVTREARPARAPRQDAVAALQSRLDTLAQEAAAREAAMQEQSALLARMLAALESKLATPAS